MRTLKRNKKSLHYALFLGKMPKVFVDKQGNSYETGDKEITYSEPIEFEGNIALSGNKESLEAEYGLDLSEYHAILIVSNNSLPIKEGSLIWHNLTPKTNSNGNALKESADYVVKKVVPSINSCKYVLQKLVTDGSEN